MTARERKSHRSIVAIGTILTMLVIVGYAAITSGTHPDPTTVSEAAGCQPVRCTAPHEHTARVSRKHRRPTGSPSGSPTVSTSVPATSASHTPTSPATSSAQPPTTTAATPPATSASASAPSTSSNPVSPLGSYPNADTTGVPAGVRLVQVPAQATTGAGWHWNGKAVVVDVDNVVLSALDISGAVLNSRSGLTVRNTRIRCQNESSWCLSLGPGSSVTDTEIGGGADGATYLPAIGVLSGRYNQTSRLSTLTRVDIHHTVHGMRVDGDTTVTDSFIHDMPMGDPGFSTAHTDGAMSTAGANITFTHNRFESGNNAPLFVQWQSGNVAIARYLVQNNVFIGIQKNGMSSSYGIDFENKGITGPVTILDNAFTGSFQAGAILAPPSASLSGNHWLTGGAVQPEIR